MQHSRWSGWVLTSGAARLGSTDGSGPVGAGVRRPTSLSWTPREDAVDIVGPIPQFPTHRLETPVCLQGRCQWCLCANILVKKYHHPVPGCAGVTPARALDSWAPTLVGSHRRNLAANQRWPWSWKRTASGWTCASRRRASVGMTDSATWRRKVRSV